MTIEEEFCENYGIWSYNIDDDNYINTNSPVFLSERGITELPVKFGTVNGGFYISNNELVTLKGCPKKIINGSLSAAENKLTSLEGCPIEIDGDLYLHQNKITNLEHFPKKLSGSVYLRDNNLTTLKGCAKTINGDFYISENKKLTSLKHGPNNLSGDYHALSCNITTLDYLPTNLKSMYLSLHGNPVYSVVDSNNYLDLLAFRDCKVVKGNKLYLNRLKYYLNIVGNLSNWRVGYILENAKDYYEIV